MDGRDPAGGSTQLAGLIDRYGEHLVPDLRHYFQVDLRDVFVPGSGLTPRTALLYISWLPLESATVAEQRGGQQYRGWDAGWYLQAAQVNATREHAFAFISAHSSKKPKPPVPVPVPGKDTKAKDAPNAFTRMAKSQIAETRNRRKERGD